MSLLPATSHANPTTPFWATAGGGGGGGYTKCLTSTNVEEYLFGSTNEETITSYTVSTPPAVSGKFLVNATWDTNVSNAPIQYQLAIKDGTNTSTVILTTTDIPLPNLGACSLLTTVWNTGDALPTFELTGQVPALTGSPAVNWSWDIVFYPN